MHRVAIDHDLDRARPRIVIGGHRHAVGAGRHNRQQIAGLKAQRARQAEEVAGFADRADHVVDAGFAGVRCHRQDVVPGFVERRPLEIVHRRIDDGEILALARFQEFDAGQQQAGVADQAAAGFEHDLEAASNQPVEQRGQIGSDRWLYLVVLVLDAEAAAEVDVADADACRGQLVYKGQNALERLDEGRRIEQLRTDMAVDAGYLDIGQCGGAAVEGQRVVVGHAELGFLEAGRDIGVGLGVDVRIDAQADRRPLAALAGDVVQAFQFGR